MDPVQAVRLRVPASAVGRIQRAPGLQACVLDLVLAQGLVWLLRLRQPGGPWAGPRVPDSATYPAG